MRWRPSRQLCSSRCDAWQDERHLRGVQGGASTHGGSACGSAPRLKQGAFIFCHFFLAGMRSDGGQQAAPRGIAPLPEDCASALWAGLAADAAPIYLPRHSQQERVAPQLQLLQRARGIFDQARRQRISGSPQGFSAQFSTCAAAARVSSSKSPFVCAQRSFFRIFGHAAPVLREVGLQSVVGAGEPEVKVRDGSFHLQPVSVFVGARNPRDGSFRLQPGDRLSLE